MSDLFTMLHVAARALDAQRYGLDVAGQNIANVNTPGYVRRSVQLAEAPPTDPWSPGGGVDVVAVTAARAPLIEARLRFEQPASAREGAIADHLEVVETGLGMPGASLDAALGRFYNTYSTLSQNPTSGTARQQVIIEGQALSRSFNDMATRLQTARVNADRELRSVAAQVNALAGEVANLNASIVAAGVRNAQGLLDQQAVALSELGKLVDVNAIQNSDGSVDVSIGNGRALVVGANTYDLTLSSQPPDGFATILTDGADVTTDVTQEITGGRIGGLLQVRDVLLPGYVDQLDQLAYGVATDVNTLTTSGYDVDGTAGLDFFDQPASATGAAAAMSVNVLVAADSDKVVAAATTAAGNNEIARAIGSLQDAPMTGSPDRPVDVWANLVYRVAVDSRAASQARTSHEQVVDQLNNIKAQISGVSIDEEAAMLLKFQRAYEANARFFQVADQTLSLLMSLVGGIAMRITFSSSFDSGIRAMSKAAESLTNAQRQVSTGLRLTKLSDDPLSVSASLVEHASLDRLDAYKGASDAASYRLGLADSVLSDVVSQLSAAQTSALSARGSGRTQAQRDAAANELIAIRDALLGDINTQFQGAYLFSGSNVKVAPYANTGSGISSYRGDTDASTIDIGSSRSVASTFDGGAIYQGADSVHVLDALTDLAAAVSAGDQAGIDAGVVAVNSAFDRATAAQTRVGNDLRVLDDNRELLASSRTGAITRLSNIEDVDLAEAASRLSQAETAYRAALTAISTIGRVSLMDYLR